MSSEAEAETVAAPPRRGLLLILSSPSGAGKSTLARRLLAEDDAISFSVSATTRPMRPGEVDGRDYHFLDRAEFERMIAEDALLEWAEVFGHLYGSPRAAVEAAIGQGRDVLFDVDWQGGQQIRNSALGHAAVSVFILPPSIAELEARLHHRAQDSEAVIAGRMARARDEIAHWAEYDYVLINRDLDDCTADLRAILRSERLRLARNPAVERHVAALNREFDARMKGGN
ncbi:MAG: guanylate kinase [Alphaproteobacteria bacterium]|nr:MAG: guanylate kinase [Alphaproteobacteria bacterium]